MKHLAETRGRKGRASGEKEGESERIGQEVLLTHLGVKRQTLELRAMGRVSLNELVVKGGTWLRNKVEQLVGILNVGDFKKLRDDDLGVIYAIPERKSMDLLQLFRNKAVLSNMRRTHLTIGCLCQLSVPECSLLTCLCIR